MKNALRITLLVLVGMASAHAADTAVAKCVDEKGKPCTDDHVKKLNQAMMDEVHGITTGRRRHQTLSMVKSVTLGSKDGTLKCEQNDGKPCTEAQVKDLNDLAGSMKCAINYNSSKSNTAR